MKKYWDFFSLAIVMAAISFAFSAAPNDKRLGCSSTQIVIDANRDGAFTYRDIGIATLQIVSLPAKYAVTAPHLSQVAKFLELNTSNCNSLRAKVFSGLAWLISILLASCIVSALLYGVRHAAKLIAFVTKKDSSGHLNVPSMQYIRHPKFEWVLRPIFIVLLVVAVTTISISKQQGPKQQAGTSLAKHSTKPTLEATTSPVNKSGIHYKDIYSANLASLKRLDTRIASINSDEAKSVDILAKSLAIGLESELEKTYAIYRWVTTNIEYDVDAYFSKRLRGIGSAPIVLKNRKAVCDGYSELMLRMGQSVGLKIKKIQGFAKGYGYAVGDSVHKPNHAWNAVNIDGAWYLLDSTWDAGGVNKDTKKFVPNKGDYKYFLANPSQFIHSHFPEQRSWQLLDNEWSREEFSSNPRTN